MFQSDNSVSYSKRNVSPGKPAYNTDVNGAEKLYVGRLPYNISKRELEVLFCTYGPLLNVEIKHGGFAFVQYGISDLNRITIRCGKSL